MAFTLTQHTSVDSGGPAGSSATLAFVSNNTAGGLLIAWGRVGLSGRTITFADSNSNTWHSGFDLDDPTGNNSWAIWYAENCNSGANTVTFSYTAGTGQTMRWCIAEFAGGLSSSSKDQSGGTTGNSGTISSGSLTPGSANELVVALAGDSNGASTITAAGSYAVLDAVANKIASLYQIQTTATAVNNIATITSDTWGGIAVSFKVSGGAATVVPQIMNSFRQRRA